MMNDMVRDHTTSGIRIHGRAVLGAVVVLTLCACTDSAQTVSTNVSVPDDSSATARVEETSQPATTSLPAETPLPAETSLPPETAAAAAGEACPAGEYPAFGAFDLASGAQQWSVCSPDEVYRAVIGATDEVLLGLEQVSSGGSVTTAFDVRDGSELWELSTVAGLGIAPGSVGGQGVVVLQTDVEGPAFVLGVDVLTGAELWRLEPGESVIGLTDEVVVVSDAPGMFGGPSASGVPEGLRGIDRSTGQQLWTNDVFFDDRSGVGVARGAAALAGGVIAVPTGSTVTGVDIETGTVLWDADQLDHPVGSDGVFVGAEHSNTPARVLRAVDAATGQTLWSADGMLSYGDLLAMGDGMVVSFVSQNPALTARELVSGAERWSMVPANYAHPQLVIGTSIVALWDVDLAVYSTVDGSQTWNLTEPMRSPLMSGATSNGSSVFVSVNSLPWPD